MDALCYYDWTENNIRELENEIERAVIFTKDNSAIQLRDLSEKIRYAVRAPREMDELFTDEVGKSLAYEEFEKKYICFVLSQVKSNKARAAQIMGIPRTTLMGKIKKLGLSV